MAAIFHFLSVLVLCVTGLVALALVLIVVVSHLPNSPLKEVAKAFAQRVGATAAVALVGVPVQPVPGVDGVYDLGGLIVLAVYWYGMIKKIRTAMTKKPSSR